MCVCVRERERERERVRACKSNVYLCLLRHKHVSCTYWNNGSRAVQSQHAPARDGRSGMEVESKQKSKTKALVSPVSGLMMLVADCC